MTELSRHLQSEDWQFLQARTRGMKFKSVEAGAATSVFAATAPELEGRGGLYLEDCHVAAVNDAADALYGVKSYALDQQNAGRLWEVSEKLVGERFALSLQSRRGGGGGVSCMRFGAAPCGGVLGRGW